jgi:hypothetical protein
MTAHELARKLLELPDIVVAVYDGREYLSDHAEVVSVETRHGKMFMADGSYGPSEHLFLET